MFFVLKEGKLKSLSATTAVSAYLGITEPAMFGVNLRYRFAFISAIIGSALAGAFITLQDVQAPSVGVGGLPAFLSILPGSWGSFFIGMAIVIIVPLALTLFFGKVRKAQ
jgi:PTS system trehalose-specific IIC component